jgi:hypothetical protein
MRSRLLIPALVASGVLVAIASTLLAQRSAAPTPADTTARIVASAQAMLAALDMSGRAKVQFPFDGPQKTRWSNLPSPMFERRGLRIGDLTAAQKTAVMNLLATALSGRVVRPEPRPRALTLPLGAALAAGAILTAWGQGGLPHG